MQVTDELREAARQLGRIGGNVCRERHGLGHYQAIGHLGGTKVAEERGVEFYQAIGKRGGASCRTRHGSGFYREIGRLGGKAVAHKYGPDYYAALGRKGGRARRDCWAPASSDHAGQQMRTARLQAGLAQGALAARMGVSQCRVSYLEGQARWTEDSAARYRAALEVGDG